LLKTRALSFSLAFLLTATISPSGKKGKKNPSSCNGSSTKREVKLCIDDAASQIDTSVLVIGIEAIGALAAPEISGDDLRQDVEKVIYSTTAQVDKVKKHRDGDLKIKLTNGNEKYINCENPNPSCEYALGSVHYSPFKAVREWIQANEDDLEGKTITITGVGFIDIDHKYPRNAAANEMELHPILDIHF
jgi:hypothetical protein